MLIRMPVVMTFIGEIGAASSTLSASLSLSVLHARNRR